MVWICLVMLALAGLLAMLRLVRPGGTLADRIVVLDLLLFLIVMAIAVGAFATGTGILLDLLVVVSLLGFIGTVTVARFIERRGA